MAQAESKLSHNIATLIRKRGGHANKIPGGIHSAGMPDVIAVYLGVPLYLETKLPGKERNLTKLQAETLKKAAGAGAVARVVTSTEQVGKLLDAIDKKRKKK